LTFDSSCADVSFDTWPTEWPRALRELAFADLKLVC